MAFLDILRSRKREEARPKRPPKGAFSPKANRPLAEKRPAFAKATAGKAERPIKKGEKISAPKEKPKEEKEEPKVKTKQSALAAAFLLGSHITERTASLAKRNVYTFKVSPSANKVLVKKAIKEMFGFSPVKVRIVKAPPKKRIVRGKTGIKPGFKKALVYLKEGDKIEFV